MRRIIAPALLSFVMSYAVANAYEMRMGYLRPQNAFDDRKVQRLIAAIGDEDLSSIRNAVEDGANINALGTHRTTPLHWALTKPRIAVETVELLLALGADPNAKDERENSAVSLAAGSNRPDLLQLFLRYNGDPNIRSGPASSVLRIAIRSQYDRNVHILLQYGADPNAGMDETDSNTACLTAAGVGRFDYVVLLLQHGLTSDLERCARHLKNSAVRADSPQNASREKALAMIRTRLGR